MIKPTGLEGALVHIETTLAWGSKDTERIFVLVSLSLFIRASFRVPGVHFFSCGS
jgi:hypothetical protein